MNSTQYFLRSRIAYVVLCFALLTLAIGANGQSAGLHVYSGMIRVKMASDEILPPSLNRAGTAMQSMPKNTGIERLDALNQLYSVSSYVRLFPHAGIYEEKHRQYGLHLWYDLYIDEYADPSEVAAAYSTVAGVLAAEPIYRIAQKDFIDEAMLEQAAAVSSPFNDPEFIKQWALENDGSQKGAVADVDIDITEAWKVSTGNPNVIVCVVDEGVDFTHADLAANMWRNPNEIAGNNTDNDNNGYIDDIHGFNFVTKYGEIIPGNHGTLVAGIIAAVNNNGIGVSGIAGGNGSGNGVKIMSAQTFRGASSVSAGPAYVYAADNGAVIAQSSWGYSAPGIQNQSDAEAISYFIKEAGKDQNGNPRPNTPMVGGLAIFSAGNAGSNLQWYPAASSNVVAVASVGVSGKRPAHSNYGTWVDISAPGGDAINGQPTIYGTMINNGYGYNQGTSFACPHVSGVAALILSKYGHSGYTPDSLREKLEATTTPLFDLEPDAQYMGSGLLNAARAMQPFVPVTGIDLPTTIRLEIGELYTPSGFILPGNATDQRIKWSGANPDIVSVDPRGRFRGLRQGTTQILASSYNGKYSKTCTIIVQPTAVGELHLSPNELTLSIGETYQLEATVIPENAANPTINWSSNNSSIVSVNSIGFITALAEGIATITAVTVDGGITAKCTVKVTPVVSGISLSPKELTLTVGQQQKINANITPENAARGEVIWKSSDPSYAVVDENGNIKALKAGKYGEVISVTITATTLQGSYTDEAIVTIQPEMTIPEGFSPNGDGVNDYFTISPLLATDIYTLHIMDKSGQPCYESFDYQNNWDGFANIGKQKGKKVTPGTYYYILSAKNSGDVKKGYIIIRY